MRIEELPLISVVVPIYNTDKYLENCIESIINQTYSNVEIILVDDGSTDTSPQICDRYADSYELLKVIHQENKGLVNARKKGVVAAHGEYISFVDSDDWIAKDMYEKLVEESDFKTIDIIACGFRRPTENGDIISLNFVANGVYKGDDLKRLYTTMMYDAGKESPGINASLCTKLIRRSVLLESINKVDENITLGEDAAVTYNCFLHAKGIEVKNIAPYFYRINEESMCLKRNSEVFTKIHRFYDYMRNVYEDYDKEYLLLEQLNNYVIRLWQIAFKSNYNLQQKKVIEIPKLYTVRVILYGAGIRGQRYFKEIVQDVNLELVAWVDKNLGGQIIEGYLIEEKESLLIKEYDKIIISVKSKEMADEIKNELIEMGIESSKIVWEEMKYRKDVYRLEWEN